MQLCSLSFLYLFLPAAVLVFYSVPSHWRSAALLGISLIFYSMADPMWLLVMLFSVGFDYVMAGILVDYREAPRLARITLGVCVAKSLLIILWSGVMYQLRGVAVPLGIQIYSLTALGYLVDLYRGEVEREENIIDFAVFCCFFGKLFAGPLVYYKDFSTQLRERKMSLSGVGEGVVTFVWGFAKQGILAVGIHEMYEQLNALGIGQVTVLSAWLLIISYTFSIYYSLSGYCDMARGLGKIFGLNLPRNFYYPFQSRTVQDFFDRFNITFTHYLRRYVFRSLGGEKGGAAVYAVSTLFITILMGLWFGIRINYVVWGIYFTVFLLLEKFLLAKWLPKIPPLFLRVYTFFIVMMSFTIFAGENLAQTAGFLRNMFGFGRLDISNNSVLYIIAQHWGVLLFCFVFATSITDKLSRFMRKYLPAAANLLSVVLNVALLIAATAMLV